jgi:hypothetical protein
VTITLTLLLICFVGNKAAIYEGDTFMLFADTLAPFEQACVKQLSEHKPWDIGDDNRKKPALLHKEITPNGCKAVVDVYPDAKVFFDLGSGL